MYHTCQGKLISLVVLVNSNRTHPTPLQSHPHQFVKHLANTGWIQRHLQSPPQMKRAGNVTYLTRQHSACLLLQWQLFLVKHSNQFHHLNNGTLSDQQQSSMECSVHCTACWLMGWAAPTLNWDGVWCTVPIYWMVAIAV